MTAFAIFLSVLGWLLLVAAGFSCQHTLLSAYVFARFMGSAKAAPRRSEAITLLKPLYGAEPRLADNLATFLEQDHDGPVQLLCGVQRADDPAAAAVRALQVRYPHARIDLVIDGTPHGASGKVANLINMMRHAAHDIIVLSDSDIAVDRDYLARVLDALDQPGTGAVTCLYRGRGDAGPWSWIGAAGIAWRFLPGAAFGTVFGLAKPCMGSTIAMRRETLDAIGGFERFADILADDYEIGEAVRLLGLRVAVPPMLVTHGSAETSLAELWRHEVRWGVTVRTVVPAAYVGNVMTMPLPLALLGALFHPTAGAWLIIASVVCRFYLAGVVDRITGHIPLSRLLIPLRDLMDFAVFVASFFHRSVDWRGARLIMVAEGRVAAQSETNKI